MARVYGQKPQPRLLAVSDEPQAPEVVEALQLLAPTVDMVTSEQLSDTVNQNEWDAAVLFNCDAELMPHLGVIQFGGTRTSELRNGAARGSGTMRFGEPATTYSSPDGLWPEISRLTEELAETLLSAEWATVVTFTRYVEVLAHPFLLNSSGQIVACAFDRASDGTSEWWWLPQVTPQPIRWVAAALTRWSRVDPDRFGAASDAWLSDARWLTVPEREALHELEALETSHALALRQYDADLSRALQRQRTASDAAGSAERRLLTAQGSGLVEEVAIALTELGFKVVDADVHHTQPGDRLEDLRVLDPHDEDWVALVEVRGYTGGAKVRDLLRIGRFVSRYVSAEGRPPSASWYVVNQLIDTDPSSRQAPLASNPEEVEEFGRGGGMLLDTRDLFELREAHRRGELSGEDARTRLKRPGRARGVVE